MPDVERRVLAVVDALTVGASSVDLAGALITLDLDHSALALAALLEMSLWQYQLRAT
jgi:hypothetical protein